MTSRDWHVLGDKVVVLIALAVIVAVFTGVLKWPV